MSAGVLLAASLASSLGGSLLSASGSVRQGQEADAAAQTQAMQSEREAMLQRANASRDIAAKYQEQKRLLSDQQAAASIGGGMATDPSILALAADMSGYGYQQRQTIAANGESTARGYEDDAIARRKSGKSALRAGKLNAVGAILSGVSSAASTFHSYMKPGA